MWRWFAVCLVASCDRVLGLAPPEPPSPDASDLDASIDSLVDIGCSDGMRDGFVDAKKYPNIAGCAGGWELPGTLTEGSACGESGDDAINETGRGCSIADLCASGWHVCQAASEVETLLGGAPGCSAVSPSLAFFVTAASGDTQRRCNMLGNNDLFGCGTLRDPSASPDPATCAPLDAWSGDLCAGLTTGGWQCGVAQSQEAANVTKSESSSGGALCCKLSKAQRVGS